MTYSNIYRKTSGVVLTLLISLLFLGCTKENLSECVNNEGVLITFSYSNSNSGVHFPEGLTQMHLYVFDEQGLFFEQYHTDNIIDKRSGSMRLDLPMGRYTVVSWGNLNSDYELQPLIKGVSTLSEAKLSLVRTDDKITKRLLSLYYGSETDIEVKGVGGMHKNIELINNANILHITLKGLMKGEVNSNEDALLQYPIHIADYNGDYKFDNTLATNTPLIYMPTRQIVGQDIVVETVILRMFEKGATTLVVGNNKAKSSGDQLEYNLIEQILQTTIKDQAGLDGCDYYDIEIEIDSDTHATSSIKINGWVVYQIEEEL